MDCKEFKQWFKDHEAAEMTPSVQAHLDSCKNCRDMFDLDQNLDQKLYDLLQPVKVPEHLRERLDQNFSESGVYREKPLLSWKISAPAFALVAMLVVLLFPFARKETSFASMAQLSEYATTHHAAHDIKSCSAQKISDLGAWSSKELGYAIHWPTVPQGAALIGVTKCRLGTCDTAHLIYSMDGTRFSVYIFSKELIDFQLRTAKINYTNTVEYDVELFDSGDQIQVTVL